MVSMPPCEMYEGLGLPDTYAVKRESGEVDRRGQEWRDTRGVERETARPSARNRRQVRFFIWQLIWTQRRH